MNTLTRRLASLSLRTPYTFPSLSVRTSSGITSGRRRLSLCCRPHSAIWWAPSSWLSSYRYPLTGVRSFSSPGTISVPLEGSLPAALSSHDLSPTDANLLTDTDGKECGLFLDSRRLPKLKPRIVARRLNKMKTYVGTEKEIRHSPWKLNRVCQLAAGLTLDDALVQLQFAEQKNSDLVARVLKRTSNLADIRDGLQISQLEVAECFATKGAMLKRIKIMGRGRHGVMHHKFSHIRVVLREIDFKLKIYQARTLGEKKKWLQHQMRAKNDSDAAKAQREEEQRQMRQQEEQKEKRRAQKKA